jgi:aminoglycoside phosphotransferase family enzyme/predicted kinase
LIKSIKHKDPFTLEETHTSWVIVGPRYTLKIKKPVKFSFLDFSTLAKRKYFCQQEIKYNRRFSSIYLKVIPIREKKRIIEYGIVMKTLPPEKRLDKLLDKQKVNPSMAKTLARTIWAFHKHSKRIKDLKQPKILLRTCEADFKTAYHFRHKTISDAALAQIRSFIIQFLKINQALFLKRIKEGKIRDIHGDLHSRNIFYHKKPYLFDCIEFNAAFRQIDIIAEISFLIMDLEFRGEKKLADTLLTTYLEASGEKKVDPLINFYKCHYAFVTGLVATLSNKHPLARRYYKLAEKYASVKPELIAIGGIIGAGKSTLAKKLSQSLGLPVLRSDAIRKELAGKMHPTNLYSPAFSRTTYKIMLAKAKTLLKNQSGVILDATFSKREYRRWLMELVQKIKPDFKFIEMKLPRKIALKRLAARKNDISDAGPALLDKCIKDYEPPTDIPKKNRSYSPSNSVWAYTE